MSNENKIRILYVQPGKYPEERFVANELHPLQRLVGGYMQAVYPWSKDNVALVCNDSGKVDGLPLNRCIEDYDVIAGNFFICGFSGEEFCGLTDKQLQHYEKLFRDPELFLPTPIGIMPMKFSLKLVLIQRGASSVSCLDCTNVLRPLPVYLRYCGPAGTGRADYRLCRQHRQQHRQPSAARQRHRAFHPLCPHDSNSRHGG